MAYYSSTLTPSRPAPQAPQRIPDNGYGTNPNQGSLQFTSSSVSGSSYDGGIGGSPGRGEDPINDMRIVRQGAVSMKDDSFGNWLFQRKWLVLREAYLTVHKNEVSDIPSFAVLERVDLAKYLQIIDLTPTISCNP